LRPREEFDAVLRTRPAAFLPLVRRLCAWLRCDDVPRAVWRFGLRPRPDDVLRERDLEFERRELWPRALRADALRRFRLLPLRELVVREDARPRFRVELPWPRLFELLESPTSSVPASISNSSSTSMSSSSSSAFALLSRLEGDFADSAPERALRELRCERLALAESVESRLTSLLKLLV
jgi:hypothetical protein